MRNVMGWSGAASMIGMKSLGADTIGMSGMVRWHDGGVTCV